MLSAVVGKQAVTVGAQWKEGLEEFPFRSASDAPSVAGHMF